MKRPSWLHSLVMIVLGCVTTFGCNHAGYRCDYASTVQPPGSLVMLPAPAPLPSLEPDGKAQATSMPSETMVQTAAKKPEAPLGSLAVPIVADSTAGSGAGTFVLSAEDAEAMGVRAGYTPGAMIMTPK
jgi:hypothetical protein